MNEEQPAFLQDMFTMIGRFACENAPESSVAPHGIEPLETAKAAHSASELAIENLSSVQRLGYQHD